MKENVVAGTAMFKKIFEFEDEYFIKIPDYQRPYVWNVEKVETLINDLQYHIEYNSEYAYYMGSILFFCQNGGYEIIDGQQRLTTLLILDKIADQEQSILANHKDKVQFFFDSPISKKNIVMVNKYLKDYKNEWLVGGFGEFLRLGADRNDLQQTVTRKTKDAYLVTGLATDKILGSIRRKDGLVRVIARSRQFGLAELQVEHQWLDVLMVPYEHVEIVQQKNYAFVVELIIILI